MIEIRIEKLAVYIVFLASVLYRLSINSIIIDLSCEALILQSLKDGFENFGLNFLKIHKARGIFQKNSYYICYLSLCRDR